MNAQDDRRTHPDEIELELLALGSVDDPERRAGLERHLESCRGCRILLDGMERYYRDVDTLRDALRRDDLPALRNLDDVVPYRSLPDRRAVPGPLRSAVNTAIDFIAGRPVAVASGMVAVLALALTVTYRDTIWPDVNPARGRGLDDSLVVTNSDGVRLWTTWIGYRHDLNFIPDWFRVENWIVVRDADSDGLNEVFSCLPLRADATDRNYLGAWRHDGTPLWTYEFSPPAAAPGGRQGGPSGEYRFLGMTADRYLPTAGLEFIAVAEHQGTPVRALVRIAADSGTVRGVYWHHGNILQFGSREGARPGLREFIFSGINDSYQAAFLAVLDPASLDGHAPTAPEDRQEGWRPGREMYYLLFPRPDIEAGIGGFPVVPSLMTYERRDSLTISILTRLNDREYLPLNYRFDEAMRCVEVSTTQAFIEHRRTLERRGVVRGSFDSRYLDDIRSRIRYWDGTKFTHDPVPNAAHGAQQSRPPLP